jgi:hypothetical protein
MMTLETRIRFEEMASVVKGGCPGYQRREKYASEIREY